MTAIALSLAAAVTWGLADFTAGLKSRTLGVLPVLLWVQAGALGTVLAIIAATGEALPDGRTLLYSVLAGICGQAGLGAFYRGLAVGTMSIVAPISAAGVTLPVLVGVLSGDRLGTIVALGLAVTFAGIVLASREEALEEERARASRNAVLLALAAALGFGGYFVFADVAADGSILWLLAIGRLATMPFVALIGLRHGSRMVPDRGEWRVLLTIAQLDLAATGLYAIATTKGALSIVSVIGALYPVVTIMLARLVLHERITRTQAFGAAAALGGVGLVTLG